MNPISASLRAVARQILAQADAIDSQGATVTSDKPILIQWGADLVTLEEAERRRKEEIANSEKPHAWVDLAPGTGGQAGDNDKPDDELLRAFRPFMDALTRAQPIELDSHGERWSLQTIKKRAGTGPKSWGVVRDEVRRKWFSDFGAAWASDAANAHLIPKLDVLARLFSKVYE